MEVIFQRKPLEDATAACRGISSDTNVLPLLTNVKVVAKENQNKVELYASNLDSFIHCTIPAEVKEPGITTVPAQKFNEIVMEMPDADVQFKYDGTKVTITCLDNVYRLSVLPPEDFPNWPNFEPTSSIEVPQAELKKAVSYILFSIPSSDPRKVLLGGLFDLKENLLITVSTDGKKLSYYEVEPSEVRGKGELKAIIPHRILSEINKYLKDEGNVNIDLSSNQVLFSFGNFKYTAKLIEGTYPPYEIVIPKEYMAEVTFDSETFDFALRRAGVLVDEKTYGVVMFFSKNKVEMRTNNYEVGSFDGYCPVDYSGEDFKIVFNYKNVHEILRLFGKCDVEMKMKGVEAPTVFKMKEFSKAFFIIMPIKSSDMPPEYSENNSDNDSIEQDKYDDSYYNDEDKEEDEEKIDEDKIRDISEEKPVIEEVENNQETTSSEDSSSDEKEGKKKRGKKKKE